MFRPMGSDSSCSDDAWLDENCGADGWAMTPSALREMLNDAVSIYFVDATLASAFIARWCVGVQRGNGGGRFQAPGRRAGCEDRCEHAPNAITHAAR